MGRILGQAGISLPDTYDVEGSEAQLEELVTKETQTVHDMASTIFSERVSGSIRRRATGALAQNITFEQLITGLPNTPFRILGLAVVASATARLASVVVSARDPVLGREVPLWIWSNAAGTEVAVRWEDDGAPATNEFYLQPTVYNGLIPSMQFGSDQPGSIPDIAFRGITSGFGAGTVDTKLVLLIAFSEVAGISSFGLPIPGW